MAIKIELEEKRKEKNMMKRRINEIKNKMKKMKTGT